MTSKFPRAVFIIVSLSPTPLGSACKFIVSTPSPVCGLVSHKREQSERGRGETTSILISRPTDEDKVNNQPLNGCHVIDLLSGHHWDTHAYANLGSRVGAQYASWELMNNRLLPSHFHEKPEDYSYFLNA